MHKTRAGAPRLRRQGHEIRPPSRATLNEPSTPAALREAYGCGHWCASGEGAPRRQGAVCVWLQGSELLIEVAQHASGVVHPVIDRVRLRGQQVLDLLEPSDEAMG